MDSENWSEYKFLLFLPNILMLNQPQIENEIKISLFKIFFIAFILIFNTENAELTEFHREMIWFIFLYCENLIIPLCNSEFSVRPVLNFADNVSRMSLH